MALVADAIKDCSKRRGIILDPFVGSGTTIIAAEKTGRRAYAMELDPKYVQTAIRRWEIFTGEDAVHIPSDLVFHELREMRVREAEPTKGEPDPPPVPPGSKEVRHAE